MLVVKVRSNTVDFQPIILKHLMLIMASLKWFQMALCNYTHTHSYKYMHKFVHQRTDLLIGCVGCYISFVGSKFAPFFVAEKIVVIAQRHRCYDKCIQIAIHSRSLTLITAPHVCVSGCVLVCVRSILDCHVSTYLSTCRLCGYVCGKR